MRILVTGSEGQLGRCIRDAAADSTDEYIFYDVDDLDITDPEAVDLMIKCNDIQVIVNCAAFTDVERAEWQEDIAERVNATAAGYLARAAARYNALMIQISTDYVFGGNSNNTPCTEEQTPNPTGAYGRTKLHGEQAIIDSGCRAIIFRTSWLYSEYGKNFVKTILNLTASRPQLKVVIDQVGSPTYARDLAAAIVDIIAGRKADGNEGIYNFSDEGVCSWFDFAKMTAKYAGRSGCDIEPCRSSEFPSAVARPSYSVLDKTRYKSTFHMPVPYWIDSLKACVENLINDNNER